MAWKVTHTKVGDESLTRLQMGPVDFTLTETQLTELINAVVLGENITLSNGDSELIVFAKNSSHPEEWLDFLQGDD